MNQNPLLLPALLYQPGASGWLITTGIRREGGKRKTVR
jgi:hypothetical protein